MNTIAKVTAASLASLLIHTAHATNVKPLGIHLEHFDYPYPVSHLDLQVQRQPLKLAYMDVRPESPNGKTIVLLHGKNFCGAYWGRTAADLAAYGFRVIIPDQIGFCKSSKPEQFHYSFQQLAQNTRTLLDSLEIGSATIVGHSMGGMLAVRYALMYPQLTEKLVLVNPIGLEDWKLNVPYQTVDDWYDRELKKDYDTIKGYQLKNYYDGTWRAEYDQWVDILAGVTVSVEYPLAAWNQALTYNMIFTQPVLYEFEQLNPPTLLIIGQRDKTALGKDLVSEDVRKSLGNYPALGRLAAEKIPEATLIPLDDVGHLPHIEAYERFFDPLLEFLQGTHSKADSRK